MGNRAVIAFTRDGSKPDLGVYLHWNGGPESVYCFLDAMQELGWRFEEGYGTARLAQLAGQLFGSNGLSVGIVAITTLADVDPGDNGVYVVQGQQYAEGRTPNTKPYTVTRWHNGKKASATATKAERAEAMQHAYRNPTDGTPSLVAQLVALGKGEAKPAECAA